MNSCGIPQDQFEELRKSCQAVKANAYCPYSNFRVGCAVLAKSGFVTKKCDKAIFYFIDDFTEKFTLVAMLKIAATG